MGRAVAASPPSDDGAADATQGDAPLEPPPAPAPPQQPHDATSAVASEAAARLQRLALNGGARSKDDAPPSSLDSPRGSGGGSSPRAHAVVQIGFDAPPLPSGAEASTRERGALGAASRSDAQQHSALHRTFSRDSLLRDELSGNASPRSGSSVGSLGSAAGSPLRPPAHQPPASLSLPLSPPRAAPAPAAARVAPLVVLPPAWPPPRAPGPRPGGDVAPGTPAAWGPAAAAVSVPVRRPSDSSASAEPASPPPSLSPSPLSPLWLRGPGGESGASAHAGGSCGVRRPLARADSGGAPGRMLLGSFEQSLLSGRALWGRGVPPQRLPGFTAVLCVRAVGEAQERAPAKRRLPFAAECSMGAPGGAAPPYCASIALDGGGGGGGGGVATGERIRVPLRGELVLVLSNPEATPLHTFRVPYDLGGPLAQAEAADAAAPYAPAAAAKAYVRQRVFAVPRNGPPHAIGTLRYALQLRFVSPAARPARSGSARRSRDAADEPVAGAAPSATQPPRRKLYLQGDLRVVFPPRRPDEDAESLRVQTDAPLIEAAREPGAAYSESV